MKPLAHLKQNKKQLRCGILSGKAITHDLSSIIKSTRDTMRQDTGTGSDELRILRLG